MGKTFTIIVQPSENYSIDFNKTKQTITFNTTEANVEYFKFSFTMEYESFVDLVEDYANHPVKYFSNKPNEAPPHYLNVLFILFLGGCSACYDDWPDCLSSVNILAPSKGLGRAGNIHTFKIFAKRVFPKTQGRELDLEEKAKSYKFFNALKTYHILAKLQNSVSKFNLVINTIITTISAISGVSLAVITAIKSMNIVKQTSYIYNLCFLYILIGIFTLSSLILGKRILDLNSKIKNCGLKELEQSSMSTTCKILFNYNSFEKEFLATKINSNP